MIEEKQGSVVTAQYVWTPFYVDQMVERDDHNPSTAGTSLNRRLYPTTDADNNTTSLTNSSGMMVEQYKYDPYGGVTITNASGSAITVSAFNWIYLHQGLRLDPTTGLYYDRNRIYDPTLGRFLQQDPAGVAGSGTNNYQDDISNPVSELDPDGLQAVVGQAAEAQAAEQQAARNMVAECQGVGTNTAASAVAASQDWMAPGDRAIWEDLKSEAASAAQPIMDKPELAAPQEQSAASANPLVAAAKALNTRVPYTDVNGNPVDPALQAELETLANKTADQRVQDLINAAEKPSLSSHKEALDKVHCEVGKLPKGEPGKFGSPQAGDSTKGYRLDPAHPNAPPGSPEEGPHFNWWDWTNGKRGSGGRYGAVPIK